MTGRGKCVHRAIFKKGLAQDKSMRLSCVSTVKSKMLTEKRKGSDRDFR